MSGNALVTGAAPAADDLAEALRSRGFVVQVVTSPQEIGSAGVEPDSLQCYVQLPGEIPVRGNSAVERVRNFLIDGLISRFDYVAAVAPLLAPGAVVLFVAGNHPAHTEAPDNPEARRALLDLLAVTCRLERPDAGFRTIVLRHRTSPREVAALALEPQSEEAAVAEEMLEAEPDLHYARWRDEVLSLVHTYS